MAIDKVSMAVFVIIFWLAVPLGYSLVSEGGYDKLTTSNNALSMITNTFTLNLYNLPVWAKIFIWSFRIIGILALYLLIRGG